MSRQFDRTTLPPLREVLGKFPGFSVADNKLRRAMQILRGICQSLRQREGRPFYSMREISKSLGVPLRTVAVAFEKLEAEGLLLRLRGSHTQLLGTKGSALSEVGGVVGFPTLIRGFEHYRYRQDFLRTTGDLLWKHYLVPDFIPYWESEDFSHEFIDRLMRHRLDYLVWLQPVKLNRNVIETLRDHGIRSVLISSQELKFMPSNFVIEWTTGCRRVFKHWRDQGKVRKIAVVEERDLLRPNLESFIKAAGEEGFECLRLQGTPDLSARLAGGEKLSSDTAIAFSTQYAATNFVLRDQQAFTALALRHRILFARDCPIIPYVLPHHLTIERLFLPIRQFGAQVADLLLKWRSGDVHFAETIVHAEARIEEVLADTQAADEAMK